MTAVSPRANSPKAASSGSASPSNEQAEAIKQIVAWYKDKRGPQEFYVAGYAGVGKSVTANLAIEELKAKCGVRNVRTAAYTGKAASVLRKKGVEGAQTIHSLIYTAVEDEETGEVSFKLSEDSPAADAGLIVLDECSMVGIDLAKDLKSYGRKVLVLGDPGQLPPIGGQGAFTNREPDVFLREIHRQAAESPIIYLSMLAREGKPLPLGFDRDGVRVLPLNRDTQPLIYREETQPICGKNSVRMTYNLRLRRMRGFDGEIPQVGERIMCRKNHWSEGLFNGGMGTVLAIETQHDGVPGTYKMDVQMDDLEAPTCELQVDPYLFRRHFTNGEAKKLQFSGKGPWLDELDWSATITAHVSQGSSWDDVTVIDDSAAFREHRRNWLYTSVTRSERSLTVLLRV